MLKAYISALIEYAEKDERILHLLADSGEGFDALFRHKYPDRMFNFGISEQNMLGAAAGLSLSGKIPFVFAQGAFLTYRALEFIRNDICLQNANVKMIGTGSGLSLSTLGPSHHTTEDVAVLRAMPNLCIMSVSAPSQVKRCIEESLKTRSPVYIKLAMNCDEYEKGSDVMHCDGIDIYNSSDGYDVLIISEGLLLRNCLEACRLLSGKGIKAAVADIWRIKPFNTELFKELLGKCRFCCAAEEHNIHGGLGSVAAEIMAFSGCGKKLLTLGLSDRFAAGYGSHAEIQQTNGLSSRAIADAISHQESLITEEYKYE